MIKHRRIHPHEAKGFMFAVLGSLMYAAMATFVKLSVEISNETLIFFRNLIGLIVILPVFMRGKITLKTTQFPLLLSRAVFGLSAIYGYFYAIQHLPLTNAVLLASTIPLFTPLVVFFWLKVRVPKRRILAVIFGFIGIVIVLKPTEFSVEIASVVGLLAGLFGAIATVSIRRLSKTEPASRILFYFFLLSVVLSFFPMSLTFQSIPLKSWLLIVGVGLSAVFFQYFMTKAFSYVPATKVSSLMYLNVVFGGIAGWMFFNQIPSISFLIGACFVVIGGVLALVDKKDKEIMPS